MVEYEDYSDSEDCGENKQDRKGFKFPDPEGPCRCGKHANFSECQASAIPDFLAEHAKLEGERAYRLQCEEEARFFKLNDRYIGRLVLAIALGVMIGFGLSRLFG